MIINLKKTVLSTTAFLAMTMTTFNAQSACLSEDSQANQSIVLAVDVSYSVDSDEMSLQMSGYASAVSDSGFVDSILSCGCTEITVVFWASHPAVAHPTLKIKSQADLHKLHTFFKDTAQKRTVDILMEHNMSGATMLGLALEKSFSILTAPENTASKKTILISGDGPQNSLDLYTKAQFQKLKKTMSQQKISVYGVPIVVAEDAVEPKSKGVSEPFGTPSTPQTKADLQSKLDITPDFYRKNVVTDSSHLFIADSFKDVERASKQALKNLQCLLM